MLFQPKPNVAVYQQMAHQSRLHSYTMQLSQVLNGKRVRGPFNYEAGDKLESAVRLQLNDNVNTSALAATFADVQVRTLVSLLEIHFVSYIALQFCRLKAISKN
jgi:hypothetical protein